jgi:hypothetical protein
MINYEAFLWFSILINIHDNFIYHFYFWFEKQIVYFSGVFISSNEKLTLYRSKEKQLQLRVFSRIWSSSSSGDVSRLLCMCGFVSFFLCHVGNYSSSIHDDSSFFCSYFLSLRDAIDISSSILKTASYQTTADVRQHRQYFFNVFTVVFVNMKEQSEECRWKNNSKP